MTGRKGATVVGASDFGRHGLPGGRAQDRWYAVYTQQHREVRALSHLRAQGYRAYLPLHEKTIRHARRLTTVRRPFFPRYVFVTLNLAKHQWRSVNGTFGVSSLVMDGDLPQPVPGGVVESLLGATDQNGLLRFGPRLVTGENVRLLTGPFAEMVGELLKVDESGRVRILLDVMGAKRSVDANADSVVPVG